MVGCETGSPELRARHQAVALEIAALRTVAEERPGTKNWIVLTFL